MIFYFCILHILKYKRKKKKKMAYVPLRVRKINKKIREKEKYLILIHISWNIRVEEEGRISPQSGTLQL